MGITRDSPREPEPAPDFDALYAELRLPVYRVIRGVVLDAGAAEDLTQEVFERAYRRRKRRREISEIAIYSIAMELALARLRRRWSRLPTSRLLQPGFGSVSVEPSNAVERALSELDPESRALVVLTFYARLADGDVARVLGLPPDAVTARLDRAARSMRDALSATDHAASRERLKG